MFVENVTDIDDKIILRTHKNRAVAVLAAVRTYFSPANLWRDVIEPRTIGVA